MSARLVDIAGKKTHEIVSDALNASGVAGLPGETRIVTLCRIMRTVIDDIRCEQLEQDRREGAAETMLSLRGVEEPCQTCGGAGRRSYASTATWRGGSGGQSFTVDVCDKCWGTGDANRKGADLRALNTAIDKARRDGAEWMREQAAIEMLDDDDERRHQWAARIRALPVTP